MSLVQIIAGIALVLFTGFTVYAIRAENFRRSCRSVFGLLWGRQVVIDLYLGLFLFLVFLYWHEQSWLALLLWGIPTLLLGNIVTLLYFVLNFESLLSRFLL